jgi:hypothetical protein
MRGEGGEGGWGEGCNCPTEKTFKAENSGKFEHNSGKKLRNKVISTILYLFTSWSVQKSEVSIFKSSFLAT